MIDPRSETRKGVMVVDAQASQVETRQVDREPARSNPLARWRREHPLLTFVLVRLLTSLLLLFIVSILVFVGTAVLPGDLAQSILGRNANPDTLAALRQSLGLDRPLWQQYTDWSGGLLHGDLGISANSQTPISDLIGERILNSVVLALITVAIMVPIGIVLGTIAGTRRGSKTDSLISWLSLAGISIPDFVIASLLAYVFAVKLAWLPATSLLPPGESPIGHPDLLILPVATLLIVGVAYTIRMVRSGVIEVMESEYVQMARMNGVPERDVIVKVGLRNSLATTVQVVALTLQWLVGGVFIVETVFAYPGIGLGLVQAVTVRDIVYVQDVAVIIAGVYILLNLVADLLVVLIVPKLRSNPK